MAQPIPVEPEESPDAIHERGDDIVLLRNVTWADFERILEIRGEEPVPRLAYLKGTLELMSPSKTHESMKGMVGCLVEAFCFEKGIDITPYGSWTLKRKPDRGVEPDECYVIGDADKDSPDLVIEAVWTSGGVNKLEIYRGLGVREVWIYHRRRITPYVLRGERYELVTASEALPTLDLRKLELFLDVRPMTRAVRAFREALRGG